MSGDSALIKSAYSFRFNLTSRFNAYSKYFLSFPDFTGKQFTPVEWTSLSASLWELNEDNQDGFENRCKEIVCPSLSVVHKEGIIKKHLAVYDYSAALAVSETLPQKCREQYEI